MIDANISRATEESIQRVSEMLSANIPIQTCVLTIAAVVETRIDDLIRRVVAEFKGRADGLSRLLVREHHKDLTQTWAARHKTLTQGFGAKTLEGVTGCRFLALIEARNAFAHGNGRLTDQQVSGNVMRVLPIQRDLERLLRIWTKGRTLVPSADSRSLVVQAGRDYLLAADRAVTAYIDSLDSTLLNKSEIW